MRTTGHDTIHGLYRDLFAEYGPTYQGVYWARSRNADEAKRVFQAHSSVLLDVIRPEHQGGASLLDFGCGWGALYELIQDRRLAIEYTGLDISELYIGAARERHPEANFICADIAENPLKVSSYDYVIANGVFPLKCEVEWPDFERFMHETVRALFDAARYGVAWQVLSTHVDYMEHEWFHYPYDRMADFVQTLTRSYVFRADFSWPAYAVFAYRDT